MQPVLRVRLTFLREVDLTPSLPLQEYMEDSDLETLCPRAYAVVTRQAVPGDRTLADDYFSTLANLNTMVTMSAQILDDLERGHHKYLAHQMAMLYVRC